MLFDPNVDFAAELHDALRDARETGKRIIVEFGGDWCIWSDKMRRVLESPRFRALLQEHFILLRCHTGPDGSCAYPDHLELPQFSSIPFFALLNARGEVLATQRSEGFEFFRWYKKYAIYAFLRRWARLAAK